MVDDDASTEKADPVLPLAMPDRLEAPAARRPTWGWRRLAPPLATPLLIAAGVALGLHFLPMGLPDRFELFRSAPKDGAVAPTAAQTLAAPAVQAPQRVAALGRLVPAGDVTNVAPPYGAGDARIGVLNVAVGDHVDAQQVLAVLDSEAALLEAIATARAEIAVRQAMLAQSRASARASLAEARATLEGAEAAAEAAGAERERFQTLLDRGAITQAAYDEARRAARQADSEVARARAALSRWRADIDAQEDVVVAMRSLDSARASLSRAQRDLERAYVRAPISGVVLDVHGRPGETIGAEGLLAMGDVGRMMAELEVYQAMIGRIALGAAVEIAGDALDARLHGVVTDIGLTVGRQMLTEDDPAANTDARVVEVTATLDAASSALAARYTGLQVTGWIATGDAK